MLLALKLKHGLTDKALEDIATLTKFISGDPSITTSNYLFYKSFGNVKEHFQIHFVCETCQINMKEQPEDKDEVICSMCGLTSKKKDQIRAGHCFLYLPLEEQLKTLFAQPEVARLLNHRFEREKNPDSVTDIYDGAAYQELSSSPYSPLSSPHNISLTFSCDGVPVFDGSGKYSIWPLLCIINEFPILERQKHVMLCGLWFGKNKPNMNTFLEPFVEETLHLQDHGFHWENVDNETITTKVYPLVLVADSVARPLLQNFKQYNGEFGCSYCLHKGVLVKRLHGKARVYPVQATELRTAAQTEEYVERAIETGNPVNGVKGHSVLSHIPHFNIIDSPVPDYMHNTVLGVSRAMAELWFTSKNHQAPWYIGTSQGIIDKKLLDIKPPCSVSRAPRSIDERRFWKAHEWLHWLLYYSLPVLKGVLKDKYLTHWSKLTTAISILLAEKISPSQIQEAEELLSQFGMEMQDLYGLENMTINVHFCLHLARSVKNWGPLWTHSAFVFEAYNADILDMIKSTHGVSLQIVKTFWLQKALPIFKEKIMPAATPEYLEVLETFALRRKKCLQNVSRCPGVTGLGRPHRRLLRHEDYLALHSVAHTLERVPVMYYDKVVVKGEVIHSEMYSRVYKRNSYTVFLEDDSFFSIKTFIICDIGSGTTCYAIGKYFSEARHSFLSGCPNPSHFFAVEKSLGHLTAIPASVINGKCFFVKTARFPVNYILKFVTTVERCF